MGSILDEFLEVEIKFLEHRLLYIEVKVDRIFLIFMPKRKTKVWGRWVLFFVSLLVAGFLGMGVLAWFFKGRGEGVDKNPVLLTQMGRVIGDSEVLHLRYHPYIGYLLKPSVDSVFEGEDGRRYHYKTNRQGFLTSYEFPVFDGSRFKRDERDRVVLLTGGSAALGWGATSNEQTIAGVLERRLNESIPAYRWRVVNLSILGGIAFQELTALNLYGKELEPDFVVVFDGRNDLLVPTWHGEKVPNHYFSTGQRRLNELYEEQGSYGIWGKYFGGFLKNREMARRLGEIASVPKQDLTLEETSKAARFYLNSIDLLQRSFRDQKIILMTQPSDFLDVKGDQGDIIRYGYSLIIPVLKRLSERNPHLTYEDLSRLYQTTDKKVLLDDCHLNDDGQAMVAERAFKLISKLVEEGSFVKEDRSWWGDFESQVAVLKEPLNLIAELKGKGIVVLKWDAAEGADQYQVEVDDGSGKFVKMGEIPRSSQEYRIGDLIIDKKYRFRVLAMRGDSSGKPSQEVEIYVP